MKRFYSILLLPLLLVGIGCKTENTTTTTTTPTPTPVLIETFVPTAVPVVPELKPTPQQASFKPVVKRALKVTAFNPTKNPRPTVAECQVAWQTTADIVYAAAPSYSNIGVRAPELNMIGLIGPAIGPYCNAYSVGGVTPQIIANYLIGLIKRWQPFNVNPSGDPDPVNTPWVGPGGNSYQQGWTQSFDVDHSWGMTMQGYFQTASGFHPPTGPTPVPTVTPVVTVTPVNPTPGPTSVPTVVPTVVPTPVVTPVVTVTPVPLPSSATSTIQQIYNLAGAWLSSQGGTPVPTPAPTPRPSPQPTPTPLPVNPGPGPGVG